MAQRTTPTPEPLAVKDDAPGAAIPTAVWVKDDLVCVEIVESPAPPVGAGVCRCAACHGAMYADLAEKFYPGE